MLENDLDGILIRQKDKLIRLVNADKLTEASAALHVVCDLWLRAGYAYKYYEILERIRIARNETNWPVADILAREG